MLSKIKQVLSNLFRKKKKAEEEVEGYKKAYGK
jgi:hypothetical protein